MVFTISIIIIALSFIPVINGNNSVYSGKNFENVNNDKRNTLICLILRDILYIWWHIVAIPVFAYMLGYIRIKTAVRLTDIFVGIEKKIFNLGVVFDCWLPDTFEKLFLEENTNIVNNLDPVYCMECNYSKI